MTMVHNNFFLVFFVGRMSESDSVYNKLIVCTWPRGNLLFGHQPIWPLFSLLRSTNESCRQTAVHFHQKIHFFTWLSSQLPNDFIFISAVNKCLQCSSSSFSSPPPKSDNNFDMICTQWNISCQHVEHSLCIICF